MIIDVRSDTLTLPNDEMKHEMIIAPLGDDVFGEDPTVIGLLKTINIKYLNLRKPLSLSELTPRKISIKRVPGISMLRDSGNCDIIA